jgi:regulator of sirC expression with transglutaminase-like and TPR domain
MSALASPSPRERFAALVSGPEEDLDLAEAALLVACEEYPDLDPSRYLERLDDLAATLRTRLPEGPPRPDDDPRPLAAALADLLFREEGFRGDTETYYDPRNSFLNEVLDRRTGIPITLSTVYMEVARRAGVAVAGVGLPGHFVVKHRCGGFELLVDPFHAGRVLTEADCQERLDRIFEGRMKMEPRMLEAVSKTRILERMLRNLKALYAKEEDHPRTLRVVELLLCLDPQNLEELRDRGLAYAALDCYGFAVRDLTACLSRGGGGARVKELEATVISLRRRAARLN